MATLRSPLLQFQKAEDPGDIGINASKSFIRNSIISLVDFAHESQESDIEFVLRLITDYSLCCLK